MVSWKLVGEKKIFSFVGKKKKDENGRRPVEANSQNMGVAKSSRRRILFPKQTAGKGKGERKAVAGTGISAI